MASALCDSMLRMMLQPYVGGEDPVEDDWPGCKLKRSVASVASAWPGRSEPQNRVGKQFTRSRKCKEYR